MANNPIPHKEGGNDMSTVRGLNQDAVVIPHKRPTPKNELQEDLQQESVLHEFRRKVLPSLMEETGARAQGVWIPSWFLAIILIPVCGGILWVVITLTQISRDQANLQNTIEYRIQQLDTQSKLNDERWRATEGTLAALRALQDAQQPKRR